MANTEAFCFGCPATKLAQLLLLGLLLAGLPHITAAQNAQPTQGQGRKANGVDKQSISEVIEKASQDNPESIYFVEQIGHAGAVQAIPMLEQKFLRTEDPTDKGKIAQVLVKLGDKRDIYWNYLVDLATPAIESNAPDFMSYDSQGKTQPGPSPAFIAWAQAHNLAPNGTAAEDSVYRLPGRVGLLGLTGDPRAIPLLRQALSSPNHMIEVMAAEGLAELQDKGSIPLIIGACESAPAEAAGAIAQALVYFDDPEAQKTVDQYVPKEAAKALRDAKARGKKTPLAY